MSENSKKSIGKPTVVDLVLTAMFSVIIAVCAWITVPSVIPFTLQTFGVFLCLGLLGGRRGTVSVLVYILLGLVGVPVFSGFKGGIAAVLGPTGGYIIGFIGSALIYWLITKLTNDKLYIQAVSFVIGLAVCYAFGTVWFVEVYSAKVEPVGYAAALSMCVIPFIIPDLIKIALALVLIRLIKPKIKYFDK